MGRIVIVSTDWQSLAVPGSGGAAMDLLEVKLASTQWAYLHAAYVMQHTLEGITKLEELRVSVKRAASGYTQGHNGAIATTAKNATNDAANGFTSVLRNNQVQATGTLDVLMPGVFNLSAGEWERVWIPELRPTYGPSEGIILSIEEALEETVTLLGMLIIEVTG